MNKRNVYFIISSIVLLLIIMLFSLPAYIYSRSDKTVKKTFFQNPQVGIQETISNLPYSFDDKEFYLYDKLIYEYEDEKNYIQLFNSKSGNIWIYVLNKKQENGKTLYCVEEGYCTDISEQWNESNDACRFKITDNLKDKETYNGIEPIVKEISFKKNEREQTGYLLFVKIPDGTGDGSLSQNEKP